MTMIRVDIETVVIGNGPMASLVVLKPRNSGSRAYEPLLIRIGMVEASAIGMGVENPHSDRPMTHDLLQTAIHELGATITSVAIVGVEGTTFFAEINLTSKAGYHLSLDARPSDALALAVRAKSPIFVAESVMATASYPDFDAVKRDQDRLDLEAFDRFIDSLSPEDFRAAPGAAPGKQS